MRRSSLALGASMIALALTAGPAAAEPRAQTVGDSTGAVQVGAVAVDVPVRVLSDGNDTAPAAPAAGTQSTADSTAAAQIGPVHANAPVRVASDSDNAAAQDGDGGTGGTQTVEHSTGSAQVASPTVSAPVRVLSRETPASGDQPGPSDAADAVDALLGALLGDSSDGGGDVIAGPSTVAPTGQSGGSPSPDELRRLADGSDPDPTIRFASGGAGDGSATPAVQTLGVSAAGLPLTGRALAATAALGLCLLASGMWLRLVPGGKRR
jgi:hypothetical protein